MIIVGNSHVSMFRQGSILCVKTNRQVEIKWVGALTIGHFLNNYSAAQAIRSIFCKKDDWKILSMGMHDNLLLCRAFARNQYPKVLKDLLENYQKIFSELNVNGKFGWLISPQQLNDLQFLGVSRKDIFKCSKDFNQNLSRWCEKRGIAVINPLGKILNEDGYPKKDLLQTDGIHLNINAIEYYIEEIYHKTGEKLKFIPNPQSSKNLLEPKTEPESLSLLVADELGLIWDQTKIPPGTRREFENKIIDFIKKLLKKSDGKILLKRDTDFIGSGNFRSMDLVEIYTYATELTGFPLNFGLSLRVMNTVEKLSTFFYKNKPLTKNDFILTLAPDSSDEIRMSEIILADSRISDMKADLNSKLKEIIYWQTDGENFGYGIMFFWLALVEAGKKNYGLSLTLLSNAKDSKLNYPFCSSRIEYYRDLWQGKLIEEKDRSGNSFPVEVAEPGISSDENQILWREGKFVSNGDDLLTELARGAKGITSKIEVLSIIGACDLQKCEFYFSLFKNLKKIYLFIPVPDIFQKAEGFINKDSRIEVFPDIFSDQDDCCDLLVINQKNSHLNLHMGEQSRFLPGKTLIVKCRIFEKFIESRQLIKPDMIIFNIQGMGHRVFSSISSSLLSWLSIIYLEVDEEQCQKRIQFLNSIKELLKEHFGYFGFAPLSNSKMSRGHALFLNHKNTASLLEDQKARSMILEKSLREDILQKKSNIISERIDHESSKIIEELYGHGENLLNGGKITDAVYAFHKTLEISPHYSRAHFMLGMIFWKQEKFNEASKYFNRAFALDVSNQQIAGSFADFFISTGHPEEARKVYEKYLRLNPDDKKFLKLLSFLDNSDNKAIKTSSPPKAYRHIQSIIDSGKDKEAIKALEKIVKSYPDFAPAHNDLGVLFYKNGNKKKAFYHYRQAVRFQPDNITFQKNLADFYYFVLDSPGESIRIYLKILETHPRDQETLLALGHMSLKADSHDAARIYFEKVIELDPENSDARQSLDNLNNAKGLSKNDQFGDKADEKYLVSAIVSTYNAERFIRGCIEDLEAQTIADKLEIVVVNSGSGQNEEGIIKELQDKYPNIHYLKTDQRETVYAAWNRGIRAASGKYITNANTDDRHRKDAFQVMVGTLESFPAVALVYADLIITETENESFDTCSPVGNFSWLNWNRKDLLERGCFMGPQPMWRKSVHDEYDFFDDSFVTSGDYEFWLRISQTNTFLHIPVQLGLYLRSPHSIEHSNRGIQRNENEKIRNLYQKAQAAGKIIRGLNPDPGKKKGVNRDAHQPVEGVMANKSAGPVSASIIILTSNQPKYLKQCVESIKNHTSRPCEIIFVNNNPHKSILKWLKGIIRENEHFRSINYKKTADAVKSINEGIKTSKGEYIVLMHDDVVLTDDWLPGMLECINSDPEIGVVGAMTGSKGGFKAVSQDGYDSIDKLGEYARAFREKNRHRRVAATEVGSFCMMFPKKLVSQVGLLDEGFLAGGHEVQDFCLRVRLHGYKSCIAGDVFIHHYSNERLSEKNKFFIEKWNGINVNGPMGRKLVTIKIVDKAAGLFERDEIENGIKMLLEGVKHAPLEKESYYILVEMLINNKQFKDALGILNEIPFDDQDNKKPLLAGYIKEGMGEYQAAKDYAKEVITRDHLSPIALNLEGILAYRGGDKVAAEKFFKKAIDSDPGYGDPYTNLGGLKWEIDKKGEALDLYEKGFILSPVVMDIVSNYHLAVTALREFERAEPFFRDALLLHPHSKRIKYLLIDILIQQGKHHLVLKEIEEAMITFDTDDDFLSAALKVRDAVGPMEIDKRSDQRGTISLAMIVKNEEKHLARCLASLKPVVDEIIVVDTGSNDRTREIARVFGAKIFDFKWTDDFSEARNLSIAKASGKWILVMDADEALSPLDYGLLKKLVEKSTPGPVAYSVVTRNYTTQTNIIGWNLNEGKYQSEEVGSGWIPSTKVRLFPNDSRFRFEYPVHEKLEPSLRRWQIEIKKTTIQVHHYGQMNQKNGDGKGEIYYQIGKRKLDEKKDDLVAIQELAVQAGGLGKHREAIELWQRLIVLKPDSPLAFVNMGTAYLKIGKYDDALKAAKRAVELAPRMKEAINNHALCELYRGNAGQAIVILKKLLGQEPHYLSAQFIQAAAYCCNGNKERGTKAFEKLEKTITSPGLAVACHDFAKKLISAKRLDYAISLLDVAIESKNVNQDLLRLYHECGPVVHPSPAGLFSVERLYPSDTADLR